MSNIFFLTFIKYSVLARYLPVSFIFIDFRREHLLHLNLSFWAYFFSYLSISLCVSVSFIETNFLSLCLKRIFYSHYRVSDLMNLEFCLELFCINSEICIPLCFSHLRNLFFCVIIIILVNPIFLTGEFYDFLFLKFSSFIIISTLNLLLLFLHRTWFDILIWALIFFFKSEHF